MIAATDPSQLCRPAIEAAERRHAIPVRLLSAIGRVESGRPDANGVVNPWPWTINAEGQGYYFDTKAQAVATVLGMRARGIRSIDVGCMQVNLMHHPDAFASIDQAFDPAVNADYAARFLSGLFAQTGTWQRAAARYHSATPELGEPYQRKVMAAWPEEQKRSPSSPMGALVDAWGSTLNRGGHAMPVGAGGRVIPMGTVAFGQSAGGTPVKGPVGRDLAAYRATPITWAYHRPAATRPAGRP